MIKRNIKFWNNISNKVKIIIAIITLFLLIIIFLSLGKKEVNEEELYQINRICELATLKCYYHDVAEYEKEPDGMFQYGLFKYGYKKFWIEYNGIVKLGVNANEVQVNKPNRKGIVKIFVPEAKILGVNADYKSMSDPIVDKGFFTEITIEEKANAFSVAQAEMRKNAESDKELLNQAHNNAKKLLEQYVINFGKRISKEYKVEWIDSPLKNS